MVCECFLGGEDLADGGGEFSCSCVRICMLVYMLIYLPPLHSSQFPFPFPLPRHLISSPPKIKKENKPLPFAFPVTGILTSLALSLSNCANSLKIFASCFFVVSCALNPAGPLARREEGCSPICGVLDISGTYAHPGAGAAFDGAISRTPKFIMMFLDGWRMGGVGESQDS